MCVFSHEILSLVHIRQKKLNLSQLFIFLSLFFQPALLKAIFNVDPDDVRSLIFKKEDVNAQVIPTTTLSVLFVIFASCC